MASAATIAPNLEDRLSARGSWATAALRGTRHGTKCSAAEHSAAPLGQAGNNCSRAEARRDGAEKGGSGWLTVGVGPTEPC